MKCLLCRCSCRYPVCQCVTRKPCPGCEPDCRGANAVVLGPAPCVSCRAIVTLRRGRAFGDLGWEDEPGVLHKCHARREVCLCGGVIRVPAGQDPTPVVRLHQAGPVHIAWSMGIPTKPVPNTWQRDGQPVRSHG